VLGLPSTKVHLLGRCDKRAKENLSRKFSSMEPTLAIGRVPQKASLAIPTDSGKVYKEVFRVLAFHQP
jgi:hypothetical protein